VIGPASLQRVTGAHPRLLDAVLATLVGGIGLLPLLLGRWPDGVRPSSADAVAAAAAFLLLLARRRAPLPVLALTVLGEVAFTVLASYPSRVLKVAALIAVYTVARTVRRRTALIAVSATALSLYAVITYATDSAAGPEAGAVLAWTGMFAAVGATVRTWHDYAAAMEERALRAEASKEEEARRRVAEERLRIARELHDVIAHHIALITIQAGVAGHFLRGRPDQAEVALGHIRDAGRTVLDELGPLLHVLRQSGDETTDETQPTEPVPGLSRLGGLLESLTAAGLSVRHRQAGHPRPLPTAIDLTAYRVVQEALTNAHKHGPTAEADLLVDYGPDELRIRITNPLDSGPYPAAATGTGHGLTGMRERAHAVGGSLHAGADADGHFCLVVRLPLPPAGPPADTRTSEWPGTALPATAANGRQG